MVLCGNFPQFRSKQCFGRLRQELKERFLHNVILFKNKALISEVIHCFYFCFLIANISIHDEVWGNVETCRAEHCDK